MASLVSYIAIWMGDHKGEFSPRADGYDYQAIEPERPKALAG